MVARNARPYRDTEEFLNDLDEGMVPQDRYYATLSAWLADGSALYTRGRVVRLLTKEQLHQKILDPLGNVDWDRVGRQTPHWVFSSPEPMVNNREGFAAIMHVSAKDMASHPGAGKPYIDRGTIHGYNTGRTRTNYYKGRA